jgi:hypothetical protein
MSDISLAIVIGVLSIVWAELVRDGYHTLAHYWQPLYKLHIWHHKVFRPDLTPASTEIYRQAHWYNDVPEALVMLSLSALFPTIAYINHFLYPWTSWLGCLYTLTFLISAIARGMGIPGADELTDVTHRPGHFENIPSQWLVNRPYHWRHHFDDQNAYFCGTFTFLDKLMGTALSLKGKKIAVTGASGTLGRALLKYLHLKGAKIIALTSQSQEIAIDINGENLAVKTLTWQTGREAALLEELDKVDILILNHGINVGSKRDSDSIYNSYEINAFSNLRLMELFFSTVRTNQDIVTKELWLNTSEAESNPAFSPLYELSKRTIGDLITLKRLDAPCIVRKLILGPFKSNLNPIGVMSADWVAKQIINLAQRDIRNIIITVNPLTFITFSIKEFSQYQYFKLFTRRINIFK